MHIAKLAHVALGTEGHEALPSFYAELFGLAEVQRRGPISFYSTGKGAGYDIAFGPWPSGMDHFALAVASAGALEDARSRLAAAQVRFEKIDLAQEHAVADGIRCVLPSGHVMELVLPEAAEVYLPTPLIERRHFAGIGPVSLEHVTMTCGDVQGTAQLLMMHLDLRLSESVRPAGGGWFNAFIRCRDRHHDLAFFADPDEDVPGLNHFCFAVPSVTEIVRAADLLAGSGIHLDSSLGRHISGNNVFIYFKDPSGNRVEVNTDMAEIDPSAQPRIMDESIFDAWRPGLPPALLSSSPCRDGRAVRSGTG